MGTCPPLFTNYNNMSETPLGACFDGFWYYPGDVLTNVLTPLTVTAGVAYDYNRNCVTVNGLPVAPDCNGVFSAAAAFRAPCSTSNPLENQTGYAGDVPDSGDVFYDPTACPSAYSPIPIKVYLQSSDSNCFQITDSLGKALWINAAVYC